MPSRHSELVAFFERIGSGAASTWAHDETAASDRELVYMPERCGEKFRADSKRDRYRCVLPSCGEPLTVSAGPTLRHHWRHRGPVSAAHTPETIWHETAKAALAEFSRTARPDAQILVDERRTPAGAQPDVWVQLLNGGVAFEAQYSEITTTSIRDRTERYRPDGITAVWLFAHHHPPELGLLRAAALMVGGDEAGHPTEVRLKAGHRAATEAGPLRWLNPDQRSVATAYVRTVQRPDEHRGEVWPVTALEPIEYVRHANSSDTTVALMVDALHDCTLDGEHGLRTPSDDWIAATAAAAAELERLSARRNQARRDEQRDAPRYVDDPGRDGEHAPAPPRHRDVTPVPRSRRVYDPTERNSPCCRAEPVRQFGWPDWYRPPEGTTAVFVCADCGGTLGSTNR